MSEFVTMYNLSLVRAQAQNQEISSQQLKEQIKQQVLQATRDARLAARDAQQAANQAGIPAQPGAPVGTPMIDVRTMPWEMDIPPRVKDVSIAFFVTLAFIIIGLPLMRAIGRRIERGTPPPAAIPAEMQAQMQHLMQSVDAIAIEVERISEGQRFATKLLTEKKPEA
jgi:hypothetical protein